MLLHTLINLLLISQPSFAKSCESTRFKYIHNKEKKVLFLNVCKSKNFYMSKDCYREKCPLKDSLEKNKKVIHSPVGSPDFKICRKMGGSPIIGKLFNVWKKKQSFESISMCFNKQKKSFISSSYIFSQAFR